MNFCPGSISSDRYRLRASGGNRYIFASRALDRRPHRLAELAGLVDLDGRTLHGSTITSGRCIPILLLPAGQVLALISLRGLG